MSVNYFFPVKQQIKVTCTFRNELKELTDVTATCKVRNPKGEIAEAAVVRDSAGVYHTQLTLELAGDYFVRWESTGALITAVEEVIRARQTEFY